MSWLLLVSLFDNLDNVTSFLHFAFKEEVKRFSKAKYNFYLKTFFYMLMTLKGKCICPKMISLIIQWYNNLSGVHYTVSGSMSYSFVHKSVQVYFVKLKNKKLKFGRNIAFMN